eukprot:g18770.t1
MDKFKPDDQQHRRELIADLNNMIMKEGADPEIFLAEVQDLANKLHYLGEGVSDARLADIVLQGLPPSYDQLRLMADMESGFTFAKVEQTARNMYKSRSRGRLQQRYHHQRDTHLRDSETGVVLTGALTKCDTWPVSKSIQQAHRKTAGHKAIAPLERVCTDIIGPTSPPAKEAIATGDLYFSDDSDSDSSVDSGDDGVTEGSDAQMDDYPIEPDGQRTLLCIAASKELHVERLDVKTAFLNAPVEENVWVYQAPGFEENDPATGKTQGMAAPTEEHLVAAKKGSSLRYLRGTPDLPTVYHKGPLELVGFNDSVFAGELENRLSCTGFFFMLVGGFISSASVLQKTIAQSTTEAELIALNGASQEGIYLLNRLRELGVDIDKFKLFSDAMSALSLSSQAMFSSRTKYITTKYHLLRESVESGRVLVSHVPIALQLSDLLTKNLPKPTFLRLREMVQSFDTFEVQK